MIIDRLFQKTEDHLREYLVRRLAEPREEDVERELLELLRRLNDVRVGTRQRPAEKITLFFPK